MQLGKRQLQPLQPDIMQQQHLPLGSAELQGLYTASTNQSSSASPLSPTAPPSPTAVMSVFSSATTPPLPPLVPPPSDLSAAASTVQPFKPALQSVVMQPAHLRATPFQRSHPTVAHDRANATVPYSSVTSLSSNPQPQPHSAYSSPPPSQSQAQPQPNSQPQAQLPQPQPLPQPPQQPVAGPAGNSAQLPSVLAPYQMTRRILHLWPDTLHQFERDTGLCFDLRHFTALLNATDYSAASDYLVSFWVHPFYRSALSRMDHSRVRHLLVSLMELKLTLLSMTTDRLAIDFFIEKELKPKLLSLSLSLLDVEELVRKAYCNVRVRFVVRIQSLRHTAWHELARAAEAQQGQPQGAVAEERLLAHFLGETPIINAHRQLAHDIRALPFNFATDGPGVASAAAAAQQRHERGQHASSGQQERVDERRHDEEKEMKEQDATTSPPALLSPPAADRLDASDKGPLVFPPPDDRAHKHARHHERRKRRHGEERRERNGTSERHKRRSVDSGGAREVIELNSDSDRTATDVDEKGEKGDRKSSSSRQHRSPISPPPAAAAAAPAAAGERQMPSAVSVPALSFSPPGGSATSSPIAADLQPLSSLIDKHSVHASAAQLDVVGREEKAAHGEEARSDSPPPANPEGYALESAESDYHMAAEAEHKQAADGEHSTVETVIPADGVLRVDERTERKEESDPSDSFSPLTAPMLPRAVELLSPRSQLSQAAPLITSPQPRAAPSAQPSSSSSDHQWACRECTFFNLPACSRCEVCSAVRPHSAAAVSSASSSSSLFASSSSTSAASTSYRAALSGSPPFVPPAQLGRPLPPHGPRTQQTARKSTGPRYGSARTNARDGR